ncbi:MAG: D-alanyl-D-alanine dipeptidase [Rhodospirillales bacterium]
MDLIPITEADHGVLLDIVYATERNFTGKPIYGRADCYLHREALPLLEEAVRLAGRQGFKLKVFDAFRPSEAQWAMWNHTPDPEFLSDPRRGSPHSRGVAVDLTLVDAASGVELDMGTGFDAFQPESHHGHPGIPLEAERNRLMLMGLMTTAGWDFFRNEWWHYQMFNARARFPVYSDSVLLRSLMP